MKNLANGFFISPVPLLNISTRRDTLATPRKNNTANRAPRDFSGGSDVSIENCRVVVLLRLPQCAVTIVYRALLLADPRLFRTPRVVPHQFLELSILLFLVSIASTARAMDRPGDEKVAAAGRTA